MVTAQRRADFYVLEGTSAGDRELLACRLVEKAWHQGYRVFVRAEDQAQATRLDALLWTFRDGAFVPHAVVDSADEQDPVVIGAAEQTPGNAYDLMINLAPSEPEPAVGCNRLAEIADQSERLLAPARSRFRQYRDLGMDLHYHRIG
ncbi:DNA polymerase-3 subunit chi [Natronocella acetinitrilica]|uniref:DNA polymerase-3 subunit chi n=1 Tax=Natronocella acetinitrilica TaxID=414046 RepID=A0AAE3G5A5_9GAMM|nr:DNA polymerase III subunit chi [Natronocella acetinitrilica]MCP1674996.1 DNA polymerase-3 subunit chi [Natronocella acetinitrilica]